MSTRTTLTVYDEDKQFHLYIWDVSDSRIISEIEEAFEYSWKSPKFQAGEFMVALIKVMKKQAGEAYLINSPEEISDRDYHYEVLKEKGELTVFLVYVKESYL